MRTHSRESETEHRPWPDHSRRAPGCRRSYAHGPARVLIGLALCALVALPVAGANDDDAKTPVTETWYAQTFARSDTGLNVTNLWSMKSKFRAETVARGHKLVTIVRGDTYYVYDAILMTGIAVRRAPAAVAADSKTPRPFGNEVDILIEEGGEKVREETLAGKTADVYQITDDGGRRIVWVTHDERRLPIRIEVFDRKTGTTRFKEYVDWANGLPLTEAFFEPDPSVQFQRFELDEYIAKSVERDPATAIPILYGERLHGRTTR